MFTKSIGNMRLTDEIGNKLFPNINQANSYRDEKSFLATARALLGRRVPEDESVTLDYNYVDYDRGVIDSNPVDIIVESVFGSRNPIRKPEANGVLHIMNLKHSDADHVKYLKEYFKNHVDDICKGFREVPDLGAFVEQKKMDAAFYINEERKSFLIMVCNLDIKKWHFLQALITRYFPWYFADKPIQPDETAVVTALVKRYAPDHESAIEAIENTYNFREAIIRDKLDGFEVAFQKDRLRAVKEEISGIEREIRDLERAFSRKYQDLEARTTEEVGLTLKIENGDFDNEVMEYFLTSRVLHLVEAHNGSITFVVATTIDSFDPEVFESVISNRNSYFYKTGGSRYSSEYSDDQVEKLMRAMFEEEIMKLRVVTAFSLDFKRGTYAAHRGYDFSTEFADYLPNMHIQRHACLGSNEMHIRDSLMKRDYIGAFEACIASGKNMNMADSIVAVEFMKGILRNPSNCKMIQMPDGSIATPKEAIAWLDARSA